MRSRVHTVLNYFMTVYFIYIYTPQYSAWRWLLIVETCCCKLYKITVNQSCVRLLIIKPTRCTDFSNLFLEWNSTRFGQFLCPSSGAFRCTYSSGICQQTYVTYTIAVRTVKNSWWWTEKLPETCWLSFQE